MKVDVGHLLDHSKLGKAHIIIILVGTLVTAVDGYDLVSMGIVIPSISSDWKQSPAQFSLTLTMAMVGVMVGSGLAGTLADVIGRRKTMLCTTLIAGISMLATPLASTTSELAIYRFVTGLGAGGCIPITIAYASEYMPLALRNRLVVLMYTGAGLGSVLAGATGPTAINNMGWEGVFFLGGALSLLVCVLVLFLLPESVKYLVSRGGRENTLRDLLPKFSESYAPSPHDSFVLEEDEDDRRLNPIGELFRSSRLKITLLSWSVMLGNQFMIFLLALWMPTLLNQGGIQLATALYVLALYQVGGVIGGIGLSAIADKLGSGRVLMISYPLAGVLVALFGSSLGSLPLLIAVAMLMGGLLVGSSFCLGPYVASLYPIHARSTGVGWALSVGRVGAIISPLVGGAALAIGLTINNILLLASLPPILCGVFVYFLNKRVSRE
jgi:benzoate transport